jgi:hypothetical protein
MADDRERIEQILARRSKGRIEMNAPGSQVTEGVVSRPTQAGLTAPGLQVGDTGLGPGSPASWLQDRVTLSLEAQIAMIEMRSIYKLTLADMGYHNRLKIIEIRPGNYLKVEPTGCYRMIYHNRV